MDDQRVDRKGAVLKWLNRVRIAAAVFLGIVCMLSIAFWVRGYYRYQAVFLKAARLGVPRVYTAATCVFPFDRQEAMTPCGR